MKNSNLFTLLMIVFLALGCSGNRVKSENSKREQAYLLQDIGMGYLKGGNYPSALKHLLQADKLAPNDPNILNNLAITLHYRGRSDLALEKVKKALTINPKYTEARTNLAQILIEEKKLSQALRHLLIARKDLTYGRPEKVHANLGVVYFELSNHVKANTELDYALKADRNYCLALNYKVKNLFHLKQYPKTSRLADQTIIRCPKANVDEMLYYSGMGLYLFGKTAHAKNRFSRLRNKYPDSEYTLKVASVLTTMETN